MALRIGSFASLSNRLGAVDFPRVCGPPPPLIQPLSLLLSAYVCPESLSACRLASSPTPNPYPHIPQLVQNGISRDIIKFLRYHKLRYFNCKLHVILQHIKLSSPQLTESPYTHTAHMCMPHIQLKTRQAAHKGTSHRHRHRHHSGPTRYEPPSTLT